MLTDRFVSDFGESRINMDAKSWQQIYEEWFIVCVQKRSTI